MAWGVGWVGLNGGFTSYTVVNIVLPVKVGWTKCSHNNLLSETIISFVIH